MEQVDRKSLKYLELIKSRSQFDLIDIYRTLEPTVADCILFSSMHEPFIKIDYILCLKKFKGNHTVLSS